MHMKRAMWLGLMGMAIVGRSAWAEPYDAGPGPHQVASLEASWQDATRSRDVPILICYPKDLSTLSEPAPVIIFSHGLGGTRDTYRTYGEQWASYGYVVIFPQHHGSDNAVIGHGMAAMLMGQNDLQPFLDRVQDIHFVIDQIELMNAGKITGDGYDVFKGKLDLTKIGMSGHSFGAITTQAIVGETYSKAGGKMADPRVKAGIAMSGSGSKELDQNKAFGSIKIPMFYLTGTEDKMGMIGAADRRTPYDYSVFADTFLLDFNGANHMTFAPMGRAAGGPTRQEFQPLILETTTAFWDAYLKGDAKAKAWFTEDLAKEVGAKGKFEMKRGG